MTLRLRFISASEKKRTKNPVSHNNSVSWPSLVLFLFLAKAAFNDLFLKCFVMRKLPSHIKYNTPFMTWDTERLWLNQWNNWANNSKHITNTISILGWFQTTIRYYYIHFFIHHYWAHHCCLMLWKFKYISASKKNKCSLFMWYFVVDYFCFSIKSGQY